MSRSRYDRATILDTHMSVVHPEVRRARICFFFLRIPPLGKVGETDEAGRWARPNLHSLP